jgi:sugar O-acyltransferase (sialic acid O-acetyltransferase NeuD family)
MEKKRIVIIGAGGHAKVVIDILLQRIKLGDNLEIIGILDDCYDEKNAIKLFDISVIGKVDKSLKLKNCEYIIAIGSNDVRKIISTKYDLKYYIAIHPKAIIAEEVKIEEGTVVMAGAIINSYSHIGKHVIINTGSIIEHDCIIKDYVHISPNTTLAGGVSIGNKTWIGMGSNVIQGVKIEENVIVGAGSVVLKNISANKKVVGVLAEEK